MVTPPDKGGAPVEALTREGGVILASEDGNRLTYVVDGALGEDVEGNRSPEWQQVLATRGATAWTLAGHRDTQRAKPRASTAGQAPEYQFFTPDLSTALVEPVSNGVEAEPPLAPGVTQATIVSARQRDRHLPAARDRSERRRRAPNSARKLHFVIATPDLSHVVFSSEVAADRARRRRTVCTSGQAASSSSVSVLPERHRRATSSSNSATSTSRRERDLERRLPRRLDHVRRKHRTAAISTCATSANGRNNPARRGAGRSRTGRYRRRAVPGARAATARGSSSPTSSG